MSAHRNISQNETSRFQLFDCTVFRAVSFYGTNRKTTKDTRVVTRLNFGSWYHDAPHGMTVGPFTSRKAARTSMGLLKYDWLNAPAIVSDEDILAKYGAFKA